ncbi:MAG: hypothetical protein R3E64_17470 [Halioglobus sp.]
MDYSKLKKPDRVKENIWRQHLDWMEVVGKQVDENFKQRQKQKVREASPHCQW